MSDATYQHLFTPLGARKFRGIDCRRLAAAVMEADEELVNAMVNDLSADDLEAVQDRVVQLLLEAV